MKALFLTLLTTLPIYAQSFYTLTGVNSYNPLVANGSKKTEQYNQDIKSYMKEMSMELGINTKGHSSRVLAFVINDISMGKTVGLEIILELGEYVLRENSKQRVFGITYVDKRLIAPNFKDEEDVEDELADTIDEMLAKFKTQYEQDNKVLSKEKKSVTHENFAKVMGYETNYKTALDKAKKEGKELFIFMTTSYCPWCRKLENRILSQNEVDKKIKSKYIPLVLNLDKDSYPKQFGKTHFTPILYIVNSKDENIEHKFVGYSKRGEFLEVLKEK